MKKNLAGILFLSLIFVSCSSNQVKKETIIKVVGNESVTTDEVNKEMEYRGFQENEELKKDIIDNLVIQKMLKQEAEKEGIQREERYKEELKKMETSLLASLLVEKNVYNKVAQDENLFKKYFNDNIDRFDFEQVKIAHIVIKNMNMTEAQKKEALSRAQKLLEKARNGENFSDLARNFSEVPDAKLGGEIGYISRGDVATQVEEAVFNSDIGVYNKIVETAYGYEILFIIDKKEKKTSVDKLSESEKREIRDMLLNDYYNDYIDGLKKKYKVE